MSKSNAWSWTFMLVATCLFGVGLGLSLGYALFSPRGERAQPAALAQTPGAAAPNESVGDRDTQSAKSRAASSPPAAPLDQDAYWAARHLFITVNGQWLAEGTEAFLREVRPGGVLLRDNNLGTRTQTFELVKQIKHAVGLGDGLGDLPLIAVQQEGGAYNLLNLDNAPSAQVIGQRDDADLAQKLGMQYGQACVGRGIALAFAPVLDVYESGSINPNLAARTFGGEQTLVARMGLAMINGLRQGGVLPVVKHFPGYGAATYGPDGLLVVLNKDYGGLAKVMYPFNEAVRHGVPGIMIGYVAVPALDPENPRRPAALSPILVNELLRGRWGYEGVVVADDIAFNAMTRATGPEQTAVRALAAGCDALVMLDPDPARIRSVCRAIVDAVESGELDKAKLTMSVTRLERWQQAIGNLNPLDTTPSESHVARRPEPAGATQRSIKSAPPLAAAERIPKPADETPGVSPPKPQPAPAKENVKPPQAAVEPERHVEQPKDEPEPEPKPAAVAKAATPDPKEPEPARPSPDSAAEAAAPAELDGRSEIEHIVQAKETLSDIAAFYRVPAADLQEWNALQSDTPKTGTKLTVYLPEPEEESAKSEAATKVEELPDEPEVASADPPDMTKTTEKTAKAETKSGSDAEKLRKITYKLVHTVESGETLDDLAERYKVAAEDIALWNGIDASAIEAGQQLTIFVAADNDAKYIDEPEATDQSEAVAADTQRAAGDIETVTHIVKAGDTVNKLSRNYNTTKELILELNGIKDPNHIWVGQRLKVPKPATPTP